MHLLPHVLARTLVCPVAHYRTKRAADLWGVAGDVCAPLTGGAPSLHSNLAGLLLFAFTRALNRRTALAGSLGHALASLHNFCWSRGRRHIGHCVLALNATLLMFAAALIGTGITYNHAFLTFFFLFFAVFAAALKAAFVGAPFAPAFLIFSPLPALIRARFLAILRYKDISSIYRELALHRLFSRLFSYRIQPYLAFLFC